MISTITTILHNWHTSLKLFSISNVIPFLGKMFHKFKKAMGIMLTYFSILLIIEFLLLFCFKENLITIINRYGNTIATAERLSTSESLLLFALVLLAAFLNALFFITIRSKKQFSLTYYQVGIFRYIQLAMVVSLFFMVCTILLISLGITHAPEPHWLIIKHVKILNAFLIFYWLDSSRIDLSAMFKSFEQSVNLVFYNLPFCLLIITLSLLLNCLVGMFIVKIFNIPNIDNTLLVQGEYTHFLKIPHVTASILFKYSSLFIEFLTISTLYTFYLLKKKTTYHTASFFEKW